ncbi:MAG TPA: alpha-L-fucosidase [Myxococcota bacterium]|nr:alpha-L-fucosidase [Myxococcota bacterium]
MTHWFDGARFGMFVHWGHSSQRGIELSWPLVGGVGALPLSADLPTAKYHETAATFSPRPGAARDWLARARRAGMRYAVLTAKHHDGFALWPTATGQLSIADSKYPGDLVREFVEACREHELRVGLYYSLLDWHHPDYPAFHDEHRPYRFGREPRPTPAQWARFLEFQFAQLRELLTGYGRIDLLWFDGGWERSPEEWRAKEFAALARELQPGILLNDRLPGEGDYDTPEQFIPPKPPARRWETCMTMNESWGYSPSDSHYKSERALVHGLCEVASRGGNLLLNVSPMADGALPAEQIARLDALARWMRPHAPSIHDTQPGLEPWQFYGPSTRRGDRVYLQLLMRPYDTVTVRGVPIRRVRQARVLASGRALEFDKRCSVLDRMFNADPQGEISIRVPESELDRDATVIELEIAPKSD